MALMRCPQCGTEFERGNLQFCPNPTCGYPIEFTEEPAAETEQPVDMQRRPGEQAEPAPPPPPVAPPPPVVQPPPPPVAPPPPPPKRPFPVVPVAIVAGAVVVVGLILFLVLKGGGKPGAQKSSPPPTTPTHPSPSGSVKPTKPPFPQPLHWVPRGGADVFGGSSDQAVYRVAAAGPGFVAVGQDSGDAAVWTSTDGLTWNQVSSSSFGGAGTQFMNGVATGNGVIVAAGFSGPNGGLDGAVWTSSDGGSTWIRVPDPAGIFGGSGNQVINRVEFLPTGFVAVGYSGSPGTTDAQIWQSSDGSHWSPADSKTGALGGPGDQHIRSVTSLGSRLVAVGYDRAGGDDDAAVWYADEGVWVRLPPQDSLGGEGDQEMATVVRMGHRLIAVGFSGPENDTDVAAWTSTDGLTWTPAKPGAAVFGGPGNQETFSVTKSSAGLVAVGIDGDHGGVWRSQDGTSWIRDKTDPAFQGTGTIIIRAATSIKGLLVAVGVVTPSAGADTDGAAWTASIQS